MPKPPKEPRQRTRTGHEIPVPKRGEFYRDLERAVKAPPPDQGKRVERGQAKPPERKAENPGADQR